MKDFNITKNVLRKYNGSELHVVIPDGVITIGRRAFYGCKQIKSVEIPSSVEIIDNNAFHGCTSLMNIEIPNSIKYIGPGAFSVCSSLESITLPNSINSIGIGAFEFCTKLTSIKIPNSVNSIGSVAFRGCYKLSHIEIPSGVKYIAYSAFEKLQYVKPQYNANGSLRAFKAFNADWSCRNFQYVVGNSYHQIGTIQVCINGFHACPNPLNVFNYYHGALHRLRFAEVELSGKMDSEYDYEKVAASDIKIVRELTASDLAKIYNSMEKE